ncbi:MAG: hypothetical protein H6703_06655 [Myxococcales bacterium]|nr:hypothetical protein [Myxococcales bacterium]
MRLKLMDDYRPTEEPRFGHLSPTVRWALERLLAHDPARRAATGDAVREMLTLARSDDDGVTLADSPNDTLADAPMPFVADLARVTLMAAGGARRTMRLLGTPVGLMAAAPPQAAGAQVMAPPQAAGDDVGAVGQTEQRPVEGERAGGPQGQARGGEGPAAAGRRGDGGGALAALLVLAGGGCCSPCRAGARCRRRRRTPRPVGSDRVCPAGERARWRTPRARRAADAAGRAVETLASRRGTQRQQGRAGATGQASLSAAAAVVEQA